MTTMTAFEDMCDAEQLRSLVGEMLPMTTTPLEELTDVTQSNMALTDILRTADADRITHTIESVYTMVTAYSGEGETVGDA